MIGDIARSYCDKLLREVGFDGDVEISITPFGLEGPWADRPATEFTLQAWSGGIIGLGRGSPERPPICVGGNVGEYLSGVYAAIGAMVASPGERVDVSMLEVMALCLTYYPVPYFDMVGRPMRAGRSLLTPDVETTKDGLVGIGTGTGQQWLDFCVMMGRPEWTEDRKLIGNHAHLAPEIAAWMAEHTTAEVLELADAFRVPHAPIGNGATIPVTDHFVERGSIVEGAPGPPFRITTARSPGNSPPKERAIASRIEGLRVLDLTAFWAGPLCTHILAMLGAEVIHVESTSRPDGTRMLSGLKFSEPNWWERCGIFSGLNTNKKSVTLDLTTDRGRELLKELLATCDVVVENFTPRVLEQLGLDWDSARAIKPDLVMVRMPGFGLDGPWRDKPAFAFIIEDAAGLTWMTGYPDANPVSPYCVGDSNAGLHALVGLLHALELRRRTGDGVHVEAAMVDAALSIAAEQITEYAQHGRLLERNGNRGPEGTVQDLFATADGDDSWVAISALTDADQRALLYATGGESLHEWCASRTGDEIVKVLWDMGIAVGKVMQPHEQPELEQLQARRFFESVEHPVAGVARHSTLPMRFAQRSAPFHSRHAPLLGEHNRELLSGLGLSDDEIAALEADGVIGRAPAMGK